MTEDTVTDAVDAALAGEEAAEATGAAPQLEIAEAPPARRHGVMHNRDFVKLWTGETISLTGTAITQFALPLVAILTLKATVFQVGLLNATRYAPVVVLSLFAGVWLDRRRRRPILVSCSAANAVLIGLVPVAYETHFLSMPLLYAICLVVGSVTVVFDVGVLSFVPWLVEKDLIAESNTMIQTSTSVAGIVGPGLAGFLVGLIGAPVALAVDAVSYVCSALGLSSIRKPEAVPAKPEVRPSVRSSIAEGLRAVWGTPLLMGLLTQSATFNFLQNAFLTIFMVYGIRYLHLSAFRLGIVVGAIAFGGVFGAMTANRLRLRIGLGKLVWTATIVAAVCPLVLTLPRSNSVASVAALAATEAVFGYTLLAFNVNTLTIRQRITPNRLLGRMNASYRMILFGTGPIGAILGGLLANQIGLRPALVVVAFLLLSPIAWTTFSPIFRLKDMPDPAPEPA